MKRSELLIEDNPRCVRPLRCCGPSGFPLRSGRRLAVLRSSLRKCVGRFLLPSVPLHNPSDQTFRKKIPSIGVSPRHAGEMDLGPTEYEPVSPSPTQVTRLRVPDGAPRRLRVSTGPRAGQGRRFSVRTRLRQVTRASCCTPDPGQGATTSACRRRCSPTACPCAACRSAGGPEAAGRKGREAGLRMR